MDFQPPLNNTETRGYLSQEDKRKFTITAGILGAVFFIAQFFVPFAMMMAIMPFTDLAMNMSKPSRGTYWKDAIWYIETPTASDSKTCVLKKLKLGSKDEPKNICEVSFKNPWLLSSEDRLWIISSSVVACYKKNKLNIVYETTQLGDVSRPFLYHGHPAVVESRPTGLSLMVFRENEWQKESSIAINAQKVPTDLDSHLQVLPQQDILHFFLAYGYTVFYKKGSIDMQQDDPNSWQTVCPDGSSWQTLLINEEPVVFHSISQDSKEEIVGIKMYDGIWRTFFSHYTSTDVYDFGVYPLPQSDKFAVLVQSFFDSIQLFEVDGTNIVAQKRYGKSSPFPRAFVLMMFIPQGLTLLMPLILAIILSGLMRKHRKIHYQAGPSSIPFASLTRRALAQIIDAIFLGGAVLLGFVFMMLSISRIEEMFSEERLFPWLMFGLMFGALLWVAFWLLLFSVLEGRWGVTPGKWLLRIRVIGTDLQHCGFGRALIRNLLKFVDGFFNFMVGVMVAALTENWQRVGDMAARTVVIYIGKKNNQVEEISSDKAI